MAPLLYDLSVPLLIRQLELIRTFMQKGASWAKDNNYPEEKLIQSRIAPDMFPLPFQIQTCCDDSIKLLNRLGGADLRLLPRDEKTFAELDSRIEKTLDILKSFKPEGFDGAETRRVVFMVGPAEVTYEGTGYLLEVGIPNFIFHKTTAYNLLRGAGVNLGKVDFIGFPSLGMKLPEGVKFP